MGKAVNR